MDVHYALTSQQGRRPQPVGYDLVGAGTGEPVATVSIERDAKFGACLHETKHGVAGGAPGFTDSASGNFPLGDKDTNVVFRTVGMERDFWTIEYAQQLGLLAMETRKQAVQHDVAGGPGEDAGEACPQGPGPFGVGIALPDLEVAIEPPDECPGQLDGLAVCL